MNGNLGHSSSHLVTTSPAGAASRWQGVVLPVTIGLVLGAWVAMDPFLSHDLHWYVTPNYYLPRVLPFFPTIALGVALIVIQLVFGGRNLIFAKRDEIFAGLLVIGLVFNGVDLGGAPPILVSLAIVLPLWLLVVAAERRTVIVWLTAGRLAHVRALFEKLRVAGLELSDTEMDLKLRENIMVGTTSSGPRQAYLVDPSFKATDKTDAELRAFYDGLFARIAGR